ncbi:MAG: permease [Bacteroidales bacterium]|nr:permease [Bacteroidales bacterium]
MEYIQAYFSEFFRLLIEMAPWLLLGFFFAGLLHVYMPEGSVPKYMGGKNLKSVVYAALLGIPLPLCSCGVIPTGVAFYKEGASKGASVSFLISTPQTGVDSIFATYSLLGLPFAVLRPVVAFFSGIFGGVLTNVATKKDQPKTQAARTVYHADPIKTNKLIMMFRYAFYEFLMDIARWLVIGLAVAALISLLLPEDFFTSYLDNQFLSMFIVLVASIPIYVCATGSIPIAAVLMMKGLSPGAALVFLMAGPATNAATMAVIGKAIDKKTLAVYLVSIIGSAIFFGYLTNLLLPAEWFIMHGDHTQHQHELLPFWLQLASGIILLLLIINIYIRKLFRKKTENVVTDMSDQVKQLKISVGGMNCNHCKMNVEKGIKSVEGIEFADADFNTGEVIIRGEKPDIDKIKSAVEEVGYDFIGVIQ